MIPQRNISLISNTLVTAGGRRIPEAVIERDYVLAWFLTGLAGHALRDALAFKEGTALRRCWFEGYRFSEDLDFTLTTPLVEDGKGAHQPLAARSIPGIISGLMAAYELSGRMGVVIPKTPTPLLKSFTDRLCAARDASAYAAVPLCAVSGPWGTSPGCRVGA